MILNIWKCLCNITFCFSSNCIKVEPMIDNLTISQCLNQNVAGRIIVPGIPMGNWNLNKYLSLWTCLSLDVVLYGFIIWTLFEDEFACLQYILMFKMCFDSFFSMLLILAYKLIRTCNLFSDTWMDFSSFCSLITKCTTTGS